MKLRLFSFLALFGSAANGQQYFPDYKKVIDPKFPKTQNIYPIATLDLSTKGIKEKINVIYVYFSDKCKVEDFLVKGDEPDDYSFKILANGMVKPMFTANALKVDESDLKYFNASKERFNNSKKDLKLESYIKFPDQPEWWQGDYTPKNEKGEKLTFICQIDMNKIVNDDCRMFVFYDKENKLIKNICQWD
ncbi:MULTISPECIES: hypothetical protein [Niastella]|uniref:Uncharacterized protein n=1 Tax=Niastella soli TaxID=2821487 RepID=A0ABS3Z006_9BACT|nr:hypothetical protein [Niastella soli]MBO9203506.1 hypothetical protein [Niastella soli]